MENRAQYTTQYDQHIMLSFPIHVPICPKGGHDHLNKDNSINYAGLSTVNWVRVFGAKYMYNDTTPYTRCYKLILYKYWYMTVQVNQVQCTRRPFMSYMY